MLYTIPELQFCDSDVGVKKPKDLKKFIFNCWKFHKKGMRDINDSSVETKFKLHVNFSLGQDEDILDRLLFSLVIQENVEEFVLRIFDYSLPCSVLKGRYSLTVLKLKRFGFRLWFYIFSSSSMFKILVVGECQFG